MLIQNVVKISQCQTFSKKLIKLTRVKKKNVGQTQNLFDKKQTKAHRGGGGADQGPPRVLKEEDPGGGEGVANCNVEDKKTKKKTNLGEGEMGGNASAWFWGVGKCEIFP